MIELDPSKYDGERYWVVGCIGGEGQYAYFKPHTNFFNNDPVKELKPIGGYCFDNEG